METILSLLSEPYHQVYVYTSILNESHVHELQKLHPLAMDSYEINSYFATFEAQIHQKLKENIQ